MGKRGPPPGTPKPPGSGRKAGTPNKVTLLRVSEFFAAKGVHPLDLIYQLLPQMQPVQAANILVELLKYTEPQYKPVEVAIIREPEIPELEAAEASTEELLALAAPTKEPTP